jgi:hypothetical protein
VLAQRNLAERGQLTMLQNVYFATSEIKQNGKHKDKNVSPNVLTPTQKFSFQEPRDSLQSTVTSNATMASLSTQLDAPHAE